MGISNKDIFSELVNYTLNVKLSNGFNLKVRRVPFTTTMRVLSDIAATLHNEMIVSGTDLLQFVDTLAENKVISDADRGKLMMERLIPSIVAIVSKSPVLLNSILKDIIVDVTDDVLCLFSTEDALTILAEAMGAMDHAVIAKQVTSIFFGITGVLRIAVPPAAKTQEPALPVTALDVKQG